MTWLEAFALTHAVELPLCALLLRPAPVSKRLLMGLAASTATHPWAWFVLPQYLRPVFGALGYVAVTEVLVTAAEAALFTGFGVATKRAVVAALVANLTSTGIGLLVLQLSRQ